jgi:2-oxoglutarate ferredoxin oxidoreductase subunit beta
MATLQEFKTDEKAWWCPGCGDFGVLAALEKTLVSLDARPEDIAIVAGIGCSGKIGNYVNSYNFHVVHGRTLPTAMGMKLANRRLTVLAVGGDGDGFAIGMGHFAHALRRNVDITYIVMDNHIYGLTKGQNSPTSDKGAKVKATPWGSLEQPVRPLSMAITGGATFVAQGFSAWQPELADIFEKAIVHKGFSFVNVISPCVTFNKVNTYDWYKRNLKSLAEDRSYVPDDRTRAFQMLAAKDEMVTGIVYSQDDLPSYEELLPGFGDEPLFGQAPPSREEMSAFLASYR